MSHSRKSEFPSRLTAFRWQHWGKSRYSKISIPTRIRTLWSNWNIKLNEIVGFNPLNLIAQTFRRDSATSRSRESTGTVFSLRVFGTGPGWLHFTSALDHFNSIASDSGRKKYFLDPFLVHCQVTNIFCSQSFLDVFAVSSKQWNENHAETLLISSMF